MATIDDKLSAEVVPFKPSFTYDRARTALQANPRQKNVSELARQWGVPRSTARRWVARYKDETRAARKAANSVASSAAGGAQTGQQSGAPAPHEVPQQPPSIQREPDVTPDRHDGHSEGSRAAGVLLAGTALILAGVGLLTNAQFAASLGQTPVVSSLLAALGLAIDALALILPCTATVLWRGRHRLASVSAWAVWAGAVTVTLIAAAGFAAGNIGDSVTARGAKIAERAEITSRVATLEERHKEAIAAAERARAAECVKVGPVCRQRETALAAVLADPEIDLKSAMTSLAALPPVVAGDPAGEMIAAWSDGAISATAVHRVRIAGLTVMPATAGLLLSFAWLVWPARRQEAEM
jgi:transposase-like protein